jgi:hypothetical protein
MASLSGRDERPIAAVPRTIVIALAVALAAQVTLRALGAPPRAEAADLPMPPSTATLRLVSIGDPIALSQAMTLYLQAFDNQPGVSIPFAALDYQRVEAWLERALELFPEGQYPLLMASHLYAQVAGHPDKQRQMFEFTYRHFMQDPNRRWRWLAHAAIMAKHRLRDPGLALRYADAIRDHARGPEVPSWAKQMHIFMLEDMGELEAARILLGGLLDSGAVTDPQELRFLSDRLQALESAEKSTSPSR